VAALVIAFTDRPSTVSGLVQNAAGAPDPSATVLVFPADSGAWTDQGGLPRRLRAIRVDRAGQFQTTGLPAGDYMLVAIPDESSSNWQDPKVLPALARVATSMALGEGETRSVSLRTSAVPVR
jgi:hypothetical protein